MGEKLCYLPAANVKSPAGPLADLELCSLDDKRIGRVDGVIIEPARRRVRFVVYKESGWLNGKRYLLPVPETLSLDADQHLLRIDTLAEDVPHERFDADAVRPFTDEDVVTAMFASPAA